MAANQLTKEQSEQVRKSVGSVPVLDSDGNEIASIDSFGIRGIERVRKHRMEPSVSLSMSEYRLNWKKIDIEALADIWRNSPRARSCY